MTEGDLAAELTNPTAFRAAANDLLRTIGIGPVELARLTLTPSGERRQALATMLGPPPAQAEPQQPPPPEPEQPPAEAEPAPVRTTANLPAWRRQLIEEHARRSR